MLRLGIDEKDELEDDVEAVCDGLPFVVHPDVISSYGNEFHIELDELNRPIVTSMLVVRDKERSLFRPRTTLRDTCC